jgi:hypothetical protein
MGQPSDRSFARQAHRPCRGDRADDRGSRGVRSPDTLRIMRVSGTCNFRRIYRAGRSQTAPADRLRCHHFAAEYRGADDGTAGPAKPLVPAPAQSAQHALRRVDIFERLDSPGKRTPGIARGGALRTAAASRKRDSCHAANFTGGIGRWRQSARPCGSPGRLEDAGRLIVRNSGELPVGRHTGMRMRIVYTHSRDAE